MSKSIDKILKASPAVKPKTDDVRKGGEEHSTGTGRRRGQDKRSRLEVGLHSETGPAFAVESGVAEHGACTMSGEFCAYKVMDDAMQTKAVKA